MFFRRMFSRKDKDKESDRDSSNSPLSSSVAFHRPTGQTPSSANLTDNMNRSVSMVQKSPMKRRASTSGGNLSVIQLTPLWEHIIRTRALPEDLNPVEMFDEFLERLQDPEWQVRQHALRVLIDVLIVMGQKADSFFAPVIPHLVENLGHPAPTVRKGALDALRVYISETAMPESVLLEVMDIGLNQRITNEPFGGRLTCGVMLSLPSLVQATLHAPKRNYILRSTIDMLIGKMTQVTHQEVTLKVLQKIRDLIGPREFSEFMSHGAYKEFELLCSVYGLSEPEALASRSSWHAINSFDQDDGDSSSNQADPFWRTDDDEPVFKDSCCGSPKEKIIMETEIKINDDTLTMRILEREDELVEDGNCQEMVCSDDEGITGSLENTGIIHVLSDSELEDVNNNVNDDDNDSNVVPRTPKRVTFGGEIVKMRTPDSDTTVQSDNDNSNSNSASTTRKFENLNFLTVDIPNDNTKPVEKQSSAPTISATNKVQKAETTTSETPKQRSLSPQSPKTSPRNTPSPHATPPNSPLKPVTVPTVSAISPKKPEETRARSATASPFRRISISPVDAIISPKPAHKEIEVLHNLQRSPTVSPRASSGPTLRSNERSDEKIESEFMKVKQQDVNTGVPAIKSWEELDIVDDYVLKDLKSGDWRHRLHAVSSIEEALKSSDNLAKIQPCLESFLRMLLSSERNPEVIEDKRRIIMNLISRLPLENLENRSTQIITGLCRQGGAGSNRVCKSLMQRLPPSFIVLKLLSDDFLHARSSRFRENALQMVMYALMTFPSTCFDTATCMNRTIYAALDRKRRVRQASLDVLAVLGQVTSPRMVLDSVQAIAGNRDDGKDLLAAVQARLARKQLPIVGADGSIQYALRVPSPHSTDPLSEMNLGADVEWIISGIGSVSPTSLRRRSQRFTHSSKPLTVHQDRNSERRIRAPHEILGLGVGVRHVDDFISTSSSSSFQGNSDDTDDSRTSFQYSLATGNGLQYKTNNGNIITSGDIFGIHGNRIASRSYASDTLNDSRNANSDGSARTQTIKLPVTSRFPAMDLSGVYMDRQTFRNPYDQFNLSNYGINSTYPKVHPRKILKSNNSQGAFTESKFDDTSPHPPSYPTAYETNTISSSNAFVNQRRFTQVDKFIGQSNKPQRQQQEHSQHQTNYDTVSIKSMNGTILNGQAEGEKIFNKSALALERVASSTFVREGLEETQSFRQIDSISSSSSRKRETPNETASTKSIGKGSQESVVLPNSIDEESKSVTPSNKSLIVEAAISRAESMQSTLGVIESRPTSTQIQSLISKNGSELSRPASVHSQAQTILQSRPQSVHSTKTAKSVDAESVKSERKDDTVSRKSESFDELDKAVEASNGDNCAPLQVDSYTVVEPVRRDSASSEVKTDKLHKELSHSQTSLRSHNDGGFDPLVDRESTVNLDVETFATSPFKEKAGDEEKKQEDEIKNDAQYQNVSGASNKSSQSATPLPVTPQSELNTNEALEPKPVTPITSRPASKTPSIPQSQPETPTISQSQPETPNPQSQPETPNHQPQPETPTIPQSQPQTPTNHQSHPETPTTPHSQPKTPITPQPPSATPSTPLIPFDIFESPLPIRSTSIPSLNQEYSPSPETPVSASKRTPTSNGKIPSRHSSMAKSNDSIFEASQKLEPDNKSTASTTSSDYPPSQLTSFDETVRPKVLTSTAKTANIPLIRKSKTTLFGRNRRVSPIKQSIKVVQAEVFPQSLTKFEKPKDALSLALMDLDSPEWETVIIGLRALVRVMRHHPEVLGPQMHVICMQLGRAVRNLRSQVARAACQAATELFTIRTKYLEQECDDLVGDLLHRTADTNRFLRADAMRALESMCDNMAPAKIIHMLNSKGLTHQNATVRTATAKLLNRLVDRIGHDRVFSLGREHRDKLIIMAANLLTEGCLETRSYTKTLFQSLAEHPNCGRILKEVIPIRTYRNIEKTLKSII